MANLQIKGIEDKFYAQIKEMAASENRSVSQQVLYVIREYLTKAHRIKQIKTPAQTLLELSGSWIDTKKPDEIIEELKKNRHNARKLSKR